MLLLPCVSRIHGTTPRNCMRSLPFLQGWHTSTLLRVLGSKKRPPSRSPRRSPRIRRDSLAAAAMSADPPDQQQEEGQRDHVLHSLKEKDPEQPKKNKNARKTAKATTTTTKSNTSIAATAVNQRNTDTGTEYGGSTAAGNSGMSVPLRVTVTEQLEGDNTAAHRTAVGSSAIPDVAKDNGEGDGLERALETATMTAATAVTAANIANDGDKTAQQA